MFTVIIKKEILNNLLNLRFSLAYFLCTFLLVGSAAIMLSDFLTDKAIYEVNRNIYMQRINERKDVQDYLWSNKPVARPPEALRIFAIGGERDPDPRAEIAPEFNPYFHGDFQRNPLTNLFPAIDMVFIIGVIFSLLIFVLTYDSLSGEREEGTLKVILSCPVPRDLVLAGKWVGGLVSLLIPFVTSWFVVMMIMVLVPGVHVTGQHIVRMGGLFVAFTLYIGVIFALSMMVSAYARSSTTSILVLLFVWVVFIVALPALSTPLAYLIVNPVGVQSSEIEMRRLGVVEWQNEDKRRDDYLKKRFGGKQEKDLGPGEKSEYDEIKRHWFWIGLEQTVDSMIIVGKTNAQKETDIDNLSKLIARFSPYGCLQNLAVAFAGTGMKREAALRDGVERFAKSSLLFAQEAGRAGLPRLDPSQGPVASFQMPTLATLASDSIMDFGVLIIMGVLFMFIGYLGFFRMEII